MNSHTVLSIGRRCIAASGVGLALVLPLSGFATERASPEALSVKVFPDAYVADGRSFATVAALQAWVAAIEAANQARFVSLDGCGPASTGKLLTAVQWFVEAHANTVRIRTFAAGDPICVKAAGHVHWRQISTPLPYYEGDRSGRSAVH